MSANDPQRYIVKFEVYAAAGPIDVAEEDVVSTSGKMDDLMEELAAADPDDVEDRTYRTFRFDVCDPCRRTLIAKPI